jgi:hypothetical protein
VRAPDLIADPFLEHAARVRRERLHALGATFEFESDNAKLLRLARWAYAGLPQYKPSAATPDIRIRLVLHPRAAARTPGQPPPVRMMSGAGLLYGVTDWADSVVISPAERAALIVVTREMLRFPYHARYELIEFAVCTLATRTQELVPLHAACIGRRGRGLLLIGPGGSGKSTAALHAALAGFEFSAEDSVFVAPEKLLAMGVANFLHVRAEGLRFLSRADAQMVRKSPVIRRRSGIEKFEVDLRQRRFRLAAAPLELAAVVLLSSQSAGGGRLLRKAGKASLLSELRAGQSYALHQPGWKPFAAAISSLPAFELRRGSHPNEAVEALNELL